jgi:hypothetical protein
MRKKRRNFPVTGKLGGKKLTFRSFMKKVSGTRKQKLAAWKKAPHFHGQTKDRIIMRNSRRRKKYNRVRLLRDRKGRFLRRKASNRRVRRSKARNDWPGHGKAHARVAREGWEKHYKKMHAAAVKNLKKARKARWK